MTVLELIEALSKVEDKNSKVFIFHNGEGVHLELRRVEYSDEDGCFDEGHPSKEEYPLLVPEE